MTRDGKTVLKGHYGRFFEKFVATEFYYAREGAYTPLEFRNIYPSGYIEDLGQVTPGVVVIEEDLDQPYMDQYTLGIDRELRGGITASFTYIHREKKDFIETVSRDGIFVPITGVVEETGRPAWDLAAEGLRGAGAALPADASGGLVPGGRRSTSAG